MVTDTVEGMPAAQAGIGPGMKVIAVNGKKVLKGRAAGCIAGGKNSSAALELLVENTDYYKTFKLDYHGGEKYPAPGAGRNQARLAERNYQAALAEAAVCGARLHLSQTRSDH